MSEYKQRIWFWAGVAQIAFGLGLAAITWLTSGWWWEVSFAAIWIALGAGFVWRSRHPELEQAAG